jgi:flagella basal body P-ring formation protein FlgA
MNSVSPRFNAQKFILYGILLFSVPLSASIAAEKTLEQRVTDLVLQQWKSLGLREGTTSDVVIKGLPSGYKVSQDCFNSLKIMPVKQLRPGDNSIEVTCNVRSSWSLMLNADIQVFRDVVVLRDHIGRGDQITASSITLHKRNIADLQRGYFTSFEQVTNNISKRSLRAGTALTPRMIDLPIIIKRGQAVTLKVDRAGFSVDMKGLALKKGRKGDKIKVKNKSSQKVLYGTVISADLVLID